MSKTISKAQEVMRFEGIGCWLMYSDEHSDPYFERIISPHTIAPALAIITPDTCTILVNSLDAGNIPMSPGYNVSTYDETDMLWDMMASELKDIGFPNPIALNFTTLRDAQVDVLGYGMHKFITNHIRDFYSANNLSVDFSSSEEAIYAYFDRKDPEDIEKMKIAARRAVEIIDKAFCLVKAGMTERDIVKLVHKISMEAPTYFEEAGIVREDFAWSKDMCPVVLAGPNLAKGGHSLATDYVIEKGHTLYFDFGVSLSFKDGSVWSSDIQRMGYLLRDNETAPPKEVMDVFETLLSAINAGVEQIRPGMKGYELDSIVRSQITSKGYPSYEHSTGHAIGELAHNPGALLGPDNRHLSKLSIQPNAVYTIEPRIAIDNGGSIEEMVLVTPKGGVYLSSPQTDIYLIG
jgi:Xaa-Pro aminopeptidase